jgi:hypothetical protein
MICQICNNQDKNRPLLVKKMTLGSRRAFTYLECSNCGCLQIVNTLSERTDLVLENTVFDSAILQFVGSEQYKRGIH